MGRTVLECGGELPHDGHPHTTWHGWPLDARDLAGIAFLVVNGLVSLGLCVSCLRSLRADDALDRQCKLQEVRWEERWRLWELRRRAQEHAWRESEEGNRRELREGDER